MRSLMSIAAGILFLMLAACGGGQLAPKPPETLRAAGKALVQGIESYRKGCLDSALESLFLAHELYGLTDDRGGAATALNNIGNIYRVREDFQEALLYYGAAEELFVEIADSKGKTQVQINRAAALIDAGRLQEAETVLDEVFSENRETPSALKTRGILKMKQGDFSGAQALLERALKKGGQDREAADVHASLARVMLQTGHPKEAADHAESARKLDGKTEAYRNMAEDLSLLGQALSLQGLKEEAASAFLRSMKIYALLGDTQHVGEVNAQLTAVSRELPGAHSLTGQFIEDWLKGETRARICK